MASTGGFPKSSRILASAHYRRLHRDSTRLVGRLIALHICVGSARCPKLGITVSKKFGKAHERNRFKRVTREAFRELYTQLPSDLEINVSPRLHIKELSKQALLFEIKALLGKRVLTS